MWIAEPGAAPRPCEPHADTPTRLHADTPTRRHRSPAIAHCRCVYSVESELLCLTDFPYANASSDLQTEGGSAPAGILVAQFPDEDLWQSDSLFLPVLSGRRFDVRQRVHRPTERIYSD